ncbi:hypothetical protein DFQ28_003241 [Apophysomyces sp. BC1034]|nr:hypothetical protein DFQ30_004757 [Apophysomyces sp. BC1015]KAG0179594.1 hypothetical protein DFQ29_001880 [Apophysomyces sp. BC1021]KAG0189596.1 hypothetical protein DFQ28_003241 [Apophysomyces sp. BC1034]
MADDDLGLAFDFDDDVFLDTEKKKPEPQIINYSAKQETEGASLTQSHDPWFHSTKDFEALMLEHHGPNQIKNAIEHDYLYKRYDVALEKALAYIRVAETNTACKITNTREMSEIAVHCAARTGRFDILEDMLDRKQTTQELGSLLLKGRMYPLCGRWADAMKVLVEYNKNRKLDYAVWVRMSQLVMDAGKEDIKRDLAQLCINRAIHIMTSCRWNQSIEFARVRFEKEKEAVQAAGRSINGDPTQFMKWMEQNQPGLEEFRREDLEWIYREYTQKQEEQEEEEGIGAVRDL